MADETMTLEQVRDSLRAECEHVEKDSMKYAECAYQVPAWVLSDLADAIDSAIAERNVPEWQPIETASRDAEKLLLAYADGGVRIGKWEMDEYAKKPRPYWTHETKFLVGKRFTREKQPTHWMPLPAAPKVAP